ncbi:uncharacterized protein LOC127799330 isoform X3 [Diospyros lotus]|nr:uncharacterized protein LOC127799330 isoform X3 [Diospyros lotus]XP_052189228.1 uncharacterized protein LOC127799330 isoform X3 [Diospyros lotus]
MIGVGCELQGLYHLNLPASPAACSVTESLALLHNRLGHSSLAKFQKMVPSLSSLSSFHCESCQLGKQSRTSFPKRVNNRAVSPFALVHSDVWGPSRVVSVLGFQYFITFIDDYSRCTWLYLMKNRSELFSIFETFCAEIKTQFDTSVQVLRSDNAPEYFSLPFITFISSQGILHQSSCAYTPQQNEVVERKNRHLIETARTLLLHHHVPFRFWAEAVLAARSLYGLKKSPQAWFGRFSAVIQEFGMTRSESDHSVFYKHTSQGRCIYLVVYVDDIVITGDDQDGIIQLKKHLFHHFQTKDLGLLKYFLGIEVVQSSSGIVISQRKYVLDILEKTWMLDYKPIDSPMNLNVKLLPRQGEAVVDPGRYRRLVGKLNYLTITRPDISFSVSDVSQFLQSPCDSHWDAVVQILKYIKGAPGKGLLYEDKCHTQVVGYSNAD